MALILVRGAGDVGSAVAHVLSCAGHRVILHDVPKPAHPRRGMSFTDALFSGAKELEGVHAVHARTLADLWRVLEPGRAIPVVDMGLQAVVEAVKPDGVVDARMQKHRLPGKERVVAPLTVGLGPGFVAGENANVAIETAWGERLGAVILSGPTLAQAGEPRELGGHGRDRYRCAPVSGRFETSLGIGDHVEPGDAVASVGDAILVAPLAGRLRGLVHDGARVDAGAKVIEVDPRDDRSLVFGLGERPRRIAEGVLQAVDAGSAPVDRPSNDALR